ncbi:MAG: sensor domain-containing diguanylate cyclase [Candidatus Omnitrophica bacterium]|nr:sensor domain-containing diguanylate cyclase [Candidatus Omnitrophota bacterium]
MIKIPKRRLSKAFGCLVLFLLFYIAAPVYLTARLHLLSCKALLMFYLANTLIAAHSIHKNLNKKYQLQLQMQNLQEKINILKDEVKINTVAQDALLAKIIRYNSLKEIIEKVNESLILDSIAESLLDIGYSLVANNKGTCILYLVDPRTQRLSIFKTKKEDNSLIIKSKEGDIFDLWVLKHSSPLLVENIKEDFRFDLEKIEPQESRAISSLVSAPFISENKFLGLFRLDNPEPGFYSLDDLRLLVTICDLGAVALESGELFQRTQDLAIHDGLTSLYTKRYFLDRLKEELKRSVRQDSYFSLLMIDIDNFKNYNDTFGHTAGDMVLRTLSAAITDSFKGHGAIASRFGGEEFCIILPHIDKKKASEAAEKLRLKIEKTRITLRRKEASITVSIGVSSFPLDAGDEEEIIMKADKAMYAAKQKGRNRVIDA